MGKLARLLKLRAPRPGHPPREDSSHLPTLSSGRWWKGKRHTTHVHAVTRRSARPAANGDAHPLNGASPSTESGVYPKILLPTLAAPIALSSPERDELLEHVTLVVYGWNNVEPGTLSWVFPSLQTALSAARAMRNAVRWVIVRGERALEDDEHVDEARAAGSVLAEATG